MKIGRFQVEQLSEGRFQIFGDGTIHRSESQERPSPRGVIGRLADSGSIRIGIGPVLVAADDCCILIDTGLGWGLDAGSAYSDISNVRTNLEIFDLTPEDVTHVVLSHLHYDHAAGASYSDRNNHTAPTFPNARYLLQRSEWDSALSLYDHPSPVDGAGYDLDELFRLAADDRFEFLDAEETTIAEGVEVIRTGGHTPGHQVVRIEDGGRCLWYLGDLLPDESQLNSYSMHRADLDPLQAKKMKIRLLRRICRERATLLFYHSLHAKSGTLVKDENRQYILQE